MNYLLDAAVNWARGQFALTAAYHWLFVPLTLGLGVIMAIMETAYVRTGNEKWKTIAKFWQTIFGINFAIGVATGIILEFQFGTNWSNYSWFVGDIFGAPLAIEAILAFFMEATFISIMFFGWNRVSKKMHLASTWLTITGATLSALWILIANAWMQYPVGMHFNPDTVRNEMADFWAVAISPFAINKFTHTVVSSWVLGSAFVVGISSWYLLKKREVDFALKSIKVATIFGFIAVVLTAYTGDQSSYQVTQKQPMKLAAMEGLYEGKAGAGIVAVGIMNPNKKEYNDNTDPFLFKIEVPKLLSLMGTHNINGYIPGIKDIVDGGYLLPDGTTALSFKEKQTRGKKAVEALANYSKAKKENQLEDAKKYEAELRENYAHFGYAYLDKEADLIPNVPLTFYSFHVMVSIGIYFMLLFAFVWYMGKKQKLENKRWLQYICLWSIILGFLASQFGWVVAEVGRQPWTIQDVLPVNAAASAVSAGSTITTFMMFLILFTILLIAEISIMVKQIKKGPGHH